MDQRDRFTKNRGQIYRKEATYAQLTVNRVIENGDNFRENRWQLHGEQATNSYSTVQ
jgi:hypothetical protein